MTQAATDVRSSRTPDEADDPDLDEGDRRRPPPPGSASSTWPSTSSPRRASTAPRCGRSPRRLGVTKAALYYHFASKDDILMALHMRLHEFGKDALSRMTEEPVTLELWGELLDQIVGQMLAQRKIFLMHERNQAALEKLHREGPRRRARRHPGQVPSGARRSPTPAA